MVIHIGFVEANHGSYIQTIEGNTNNGRVARRTRAWNTIAAILRPAYSGSATSSGGGTASSGGTSRLTVDGSCAGHHPPLAAGHGHQRGRHHQRPVQAGLPDMKPTRARGLVRALRWRRIQPHPRRPTQAQPHRRRTPYPPPSVPCRNTSASRRTRGSDPAPPEHPKPPQHRQILTQAPLDSYAWSRGALLHICVRGGTRTRRSSSERVRHSSGRAERHEPRVAHAPDPPR